MLKQHSYHDAMQIELKFEGGKDDDPVDPGGRTNQGIIQREFSAWLLRKHMPNRDVFTMTPEERDAIYFENYGARIRFDEQPPGVDLILLDGAINSGPVQSIKWCQRALGITPDGVLGTVTMQHIADYPDHDELISAIIARRMAFLKALKTFYHFGTGWTARCNQLKKTGQLWAMGSVGPEIVWEANMNKKAKLVDAKKLMSTAPADATAAGGTVATALTAAQQALAPLQGHSHIVDQAMLALIASGSLATAFGFAYSFMARQYNNSLTDTLDLAPVHGINDNDAVPDEVKREYVDQNATGSETGNIAPGTVTTSGRTAGDTEVRVNDAKPVPENKKDAVS